MVGIQTKRWRRSTLSGKLSGMRFCSTRINAGRWLRTLVRSSQVSSDWRICDWTLRSPPQNLRFVSKTSPQNSPLVFAATPRKNPSPFSHKMQYAVLLCPDNQSQIDCCVCTERRSPGKCFLCGMCDFDVIILQIVNSVQLLAFFQATFFLFI